MAKKLKFYNAIVCEHVVAGANRKHTLINVYSGDIIMGEMPAPLNLGLFVEMAAGAPPMMEVELQFDRVAFAKITARFPAGNEEKPSNLVVPLIQAPIDKDLTFSVVATAEGYAKTTLIEKRIYRGSVPT
ncbi:MAG: hypothetical protein ACYC0C_04245 [Devosia sp.]